MQNTFSETSPDHKSGHTSGHKSGWIGLIGPTNAGKSTLLNQLIGDTLAIVTPKPQTTRHQIKGIYTDKEAQLIFCDTPGLHQGDDSIACMNKEMLKVAYDTLKDVDCICLVLDSSHPEWHWLDLLKPFHKKPITIVFNKIDLLTPPQLIDLDHRYQAYGLPYPAIYLSALKNSGCAALVSDLKENLTEGPVFYPEDTLTDRSMRFLAAEIVREQCFLALDQEIPYGLTVLIESYQDHDDTPEKKGRADIEATIIVNRDSHKGMVIGKGGQTLKKIGANARKALEVLADKPVFLKTFVRVEKNWIKDERRVREYLYGETP